MGFGDRLSKSAGMSIIVATALGEEVTSISSSGSYPGSSTGSGCGCSFVRQPHNDTTTPQGDNPHNDQTPWSRPSDMEGLLPPKTATGCSRELT